MISKFETNRPQKHRTFQVILGGGGAGIPLSGVVRPIPMAGPILNNTEASGGWPSEIPDLPGDSDRNTEMPWNDFGNPVTGIPLSGFVRPITMAEQILNHAEASDRWSSEIPYLLGDPDRNNGIPWNGFGNPVFLYHGGEIRQGLVLCHVLSVQLVKSSLDSSRILINGGYRPVQCFHHSDDFTVCCCLGSFRGWW